MPLKLTWRRGVAYIHGSINGERIRQSLGTRDPKIASARKAEEEARRERAATYGVEHEATFAEACIQYLEQQAPSRHYLEPIIKKLGDMRLAKLKPGHVRALAKLLYPGCKPQTWNRQVIVPISAVLNHAHDLGMCPPVRIKRFPSQDEQVKQAIDREWLDRFRAHASPRLAAYALFLHTTAARPTEALRLRPQDLDLDKRHGYSATKTKTGARREFWLTEEMAEELKRLPPKRIGWGQYKGEWRIFGWADCKGPIEPWKAACRRAGLDYVTPYEAGRHSFATEGITRQERNPVMVAKIGNWSDTRTLLKNYAHPEKMAEFVEQVYGRASSKKTRLKVVGDPE
jgi:integrase